MTWSLGNCGHVKSEKSHFALSSKVISVIPAKHGSHIAWVRSNVSLDMTSNDLDLTNGGHFEGQKSRGKLFYRLQRNLVGSLLWVWELGRYKKSAV